MRFDEMFEMAAGSVFAASCWISVTASPSATPGLRLNEMVTDGICPVWLMVSGPACVVAVVTESSAMSRPVDERT